MNSKRFDPLRSGIDIALPNFTPAENHANYITSLNNANTNFSTGIKNISVLLKGILYEVKAFILKTKRDGSMKMYMTAKLYNQVTNESVEVFLPDRFCNTIVPCDNINNVYMMYNGLVQSENGYPYHDISFQ